MDDDLEKLQFYLDASFHFYEGILFSNLVVQPDKDEMKKNKKFMNKKDIESLYNHFHLSSITDDVTKQKKYAIELMIKWRAYFFQKMKNINVIIEIRDFGAEVILYVYENLTTEIPKTDPKQRAIS